MMKISQFLLARSALSEILSSARARHIQDSLWLHNYTSRFGFVTATRDLTTDGNLGKTYASFTLFKGKAALSLNPVMPKFSKINSLDVKLDKPGSVFLKFWPAIGQFKYDHEKRQVFALSAAEIGSVISLGPSESCDFIHDPSMKTSLAGQVIKSLSITPIPGDSGYFFNLSVVNSILKTNERLSVPVTKAEFAVMRSAFSYILPHIMGWDRIASSQSPIPGLKPPMQSESKINPDLEWDR